jgi:hypothetical protein
MACKSSVRHLEALSEEENDILVSGTLYAKCMAAAHNFHL